jgi:ribosomal protein S18 acetylase RimI-like enzyme
MTPIRMRPAAADDQHQIVDVTMSTGVFHRREIASLDEHLRSHFSAPEQEESLIVVAESEGRVIGYVYCGVNGLTAHTSEIFWMSVRPECQGTGCAAALFGAAEEIARERWQARILLLETSSQSRYHRTHAFYEKMGMRREAEIQHYYEPDDHRIFYVKRYRGD